MTCTENTPETLSGIIIRSTGGLYTAGIADGRVVDCRAKGAFRHEKLTPLTGDRVQITVGADGTGFITDILPRKNTLVRPAVANVDLLILVVAAARPAPDLYILDKLTAIAAYHDIRTLILFNKCDIADADEMMAIYRAAGIDCLGITATDPDASDEVLADIRSRIRGHVSFFSGASGVGKTSLLNVLYPDFRRATGEISRKIERGKHTTRLTELFRVDDGTYIGDTPGFGMVDVAGFNLLPFEALLDAFPDIERFSHGCRYTDCTHLCEDGCSVMEALHEGKIMPSRHESYVKLYRELKDIKPWSK